MSVELPINYNYSDLARLISDPNTDLQAKEAIYEVVKIETGNFTIYPLEFHEFIKTIYENGLLAKKALYSKSLSNRIIDISSILVKTSFNFNYNPWNLYWYIIQTYKRSCLE